MLLISSRPGVVFDLLSVVRFVALLVLAALWRGLHEGEDEYDLRSQIPDRPSRCKPRPGAPVRNREWTAAVAEIHQ